MPGTEENMTGEQQRFPDVADKIIGCSKILFYTTLANLKEQYKKSSFNLSS